MALFDEVGGVKATRVFDGGGDEFVAFLPVEAHEGDVHAFGGVVGEGDFEGVAAKDGCHAGAHLAEEFKHAHEGGEADAPFGEFGLGVLDEGVVAAPGDGAVGSGVEEGDVLKDGQFVSNGGDFVLVGDEGGLRNSLLHGVFFLVSFWGCCLW
jgi:hypothetical protein